MCATVHIKKSENCQLLSPLLLPLPLLLLLLLLLLGATTTTSQAMLLNEFTNATFFIEDPNADPGDSGGGIAAEVDTTTIFVELGIDYTTEGASSRALQSQGVP